MILLAALPLGLLLGLAMRGRFGGLKSLRLHGETAFVGLLALQALLPVMGGVGIPRPVLYWAWFATFPILVVLCAVNARTPGIAVAGVGLLLNSAVILANGGMPVLPAAATAAGGATVSIGAADFAHVVARAGTRLLVLADVLPIPGVPGLRGVASAGDVLVAAGIAVALSAAMTCPTTESAQNSS